MNTTKLNEFGTQYTAAWCSQKAASVASFFTDQGSLKVNDAIPAVGRAAIATVAQGFMTAFPDLVVRMDKLAVNGTQVTYHWTITGTNTGPGGTGKIVRISGFEEWRFGPDGLIAESKGHFDAADYQHQLTAGAFERAGVWAPLPAQSAPTSIAGLQQMYDGKMLPDVAVATFSHTERLLPVGIVHRGGSVRLLPRRAKPFPEIHFEDQGRNFDLHDYLATNRVAGLLVLKNGDIALEDYELGIGPDTHWASFSMAKSVASTLVGAALVDGLISGLDDPVVRYVPALRGGAYEGVSIRQVLTMSSGVRWNETYTDPKSDRRKVLELQITGTTGDVLRYLSSLSRAGAPGSIWNYSTGETYVLGAVLEGATRRPLTQYLTEKIWSRAGMEQDATWWLDGPHGLAWAGGGIGATLRDYGRFGLIAADNGRVNGQLIVPEGWFGEAGAPRSSGGKTVDYGYLWWIPPQTDPIHAGAFEAIGIFGQYLYVNPREQLVIVVLSARSKPTRATRFDLDDDAFFSAVATALH